MTPPQIVERFIDCVEQGDVDRLVELYTVDALFDAHVPDWRFQVQGSEAIAGQLKGWFQVPGRFWEVQADETRSGDLLVRFEWRDGEGAEEAIVSREMQLWRLAGDRISEQVVFCAGRWNAELVAQMAAEAPLVRAAVAPPRGSDAGTRAAVERFDAAFGRRDVDGVMAAMTEDCAFEDTTPPQGVRHEGQADIRRCWEELFAGSPEGVFETEELVVAADRAIARWHYRWPQGGGGHVRGVDVFRVRDGLIAEKYSYVKG